MLPAGSSGTTRRASPDGERRRPEVGPFATQKAAEEELAATLARLGGGAQVPDRSLLTGSYLDSYIAGKINLKPRTQATNREIIELYWKPALGHLRLVDVRDHHVAEAIREMMKINRPLPDGEKPSEMLRRMLAARAEDERRHLAPGEKRRKKSIEASFACPHSPCLRRAAGRDERRGSRQDHGQPVRRGGTAEGGEGQAACVDSPAGSRIPGRAGQAHAGRLSGLRADRDPETGNVGRAGPAAMPGHGVAAVPHREVS